MEPKKDRARLHWADSRCDPRGALMEAALAVGVLERRWTRSRYGMKRRLPVHCGAGNRSYRAESQ